MGLGAEDFQCRGIVLAKLCPRSYFYLRVWYHMLAVSFQQGFVLCLGGGASLW